MASMARQRPPRASTNDVFEQPSLINSLYIDTRTIPDRRMYRNRRNRLPTTVMTGASVLLVVVIVMMRRLLVIISLHGNELEPPSFKTFIRKDVKPATMSSPILTAFLEPPNTVDSSKRPLPPRNTTASLLTKVEFPQVSTCSRLMEMWPINEFPSDDPFLPWIHDVFPSPDGASIQFVAQNKRRCHAGEDKEQEMKHWEPQITLMQPVLILQQENGQYRLSSQEEATWNETRFMCRFHTATQEYITFSKYPFNYEYVSWRKNREAMFKPTGKDNTQFWLSQLLFCCPVPKDLQLHIKSGSHVVNDRSNLWLDLIPIRTPARHGTPLFTEAHVGPENMKTLATFDTKQEWGTQHVLPSIQDSGRWANIPICLPPPSQRHRLTACTWTASSYTRRGDAVAVGDTTQRLREWILFHEMVGFERLYVYDNTLGENSPLQDICAEFDVCTYHSWPARVCNNNRPNHPNPGERSSQYAAEASCRERYGPITDWMAFIDTDEYLIPMNSDTWRDVLDEMDAKGMKILKMLSSRAKPRLSLMEDQDNQVACVDPASKPSRFPPESCVVPRKNETFLRAYNCEFIRPPRPDRFQRAMKQIYRPSFVWSHFVHYSTVTADVARLYKEHGPGEPYIAKVHHQSFQTTSPEVFLNELTQGVLLHSKTVLPHETMYRSSICKLNSTLQCPVGFECPAHVQFSDRLHTKNLFTDDDGKYCNCWTNSRVEQVFAPKLALALKEHEIKLA